MKRTYRIVLTVEGIFARKINARARAREIAAALGLDDETWRLASMRVSSKAKPERTAKPRKPSEVDRMKADLLARAIKAVETLRAADPHLPRVTVRWLRGGGCGYTRSNAAAHAHPGKWFAHRENGRRVRLPRNLVCLIAPWRVSRVGTGTMDPYGFERVRLIRVPYDDAALLRLMAHEVAHMKFTAKTHRSKAFHESVERAVALAGRKEGGA